MPTSIIAQTGQARENTVDMSSATGLLTASNKRNAQSVSGGKMRASFTRTAGAEMDWQCGVKNVQLKLPTSVGGGGRLYR